MRRRTSLVALVLAAAAVGSASSVARADVVTILPSRDNTMYSEDATRSNGAGDFLFTGRTDDGHVRRALIAFDIAGAVPAGSTITGIRLRMFLSRTRTREQQVFLHRVLETWGQGTSDAPGEEGGGAPAAPGDATWSHALFGSRPWMIAGGYFAGTPSANTPVDRIGPYDWSSARMVTDVQGWLDAPATSHGWIVVSNESGTKVTKRFDSRENPILAQRPYLEITFTPPAATITGACCAADGSCTVVADPGSACAGTYAGGSTSCSPNPCPQPTGACCIASASATCRVETEASCATLGGSYLGPMSACAPNPCPVVLTPFVDPLPVPPIATPASGTAGGAASYSMAIRQTTQRLHRDLPMTTVWGFDDGTGARYPGPTIRAASGAPVTVTWLNDLRDAGGALRTDHYFPVEACVHGAANQAKVVIHLHGGHVPSAVDGQPEATILPGASAVYPYPNAQQAATLWYHDHSLGITRLNVYMGLAGFYLVHDAVEASLGLPSGAYDVPLVIQDRTFNPDGSLYYPPMLHDHFFGDTILVNGRVWPYLSVDRGKYRFRMLNGSNARTYTLALSNGMSLSVIGNDGGLLAAPVTLPRVTLAPGERAEIVIDFATLPAGTTVDLVNSATAPFPASSPTEGVIRDVMRFVVGSTTGHTAAIPASLRPVTPLDPTASVATRDFVLDKMDDPCGGAMWMINGRHWSDITERPVLGTSEIWRFINTSGSMHPMHMHMTFFQVLDRQPFVVTGGVVTPVGSPAPASAEETGWKDTVQVAPSEIVRVIALFEDYVGRFPYHCHILEHEDHQMMRQFETHTICGDGVLSAPIEACDDGNLVSGDGCDADCTFTCVADAECANASVCDGLETCASNVCVAGTPLACDDGEECTADACDAIVGCLSAAVADDTPCSAGRCVAGVCIPLPADGGMPDDGGVAGDGGTTMDGAMPPLDGGITIDGGGTPDGGGMMITDAGAGDAALDDGAIDADVDGGRAPSDAGGCGCRAHGTGGAQRAPFALLFAALAVAARLARRRRR